jgi:uncharacterized protein DUF11
VVLKADEAARAGTLVRAEAELIEAAGRRSLVRRAAVSLVAEEALLALTISGSPEPALPGGTLSFTVDIANLSPTMATGDFDLSANAPRHVVVNEAAGAYCGACRYGSVLGWRVPSLAPLGHTVVQFTATVDDATSAPAPRQGTILDVAATADVFGGVEAFADLVVGAAP